MDVKGFRRSGTDVGLIMTKVTSSDEDNCTSHEHHVGNKGIFSDSIKKTSCDPHDKSFFVVHTRGVGAIGHGEESTC